MKPRHSLRVVALVLCPHSCSTTGGRSAAVGADVAESPALDIGSRLELFVDDVVVDQLKGATLKLHEPQPKEVVLRFDAPWEGVFWSESEQCYAAYFRTWTGGAFAGYRTISRATSPDLVHWSAPAEMSFGDTPREHLYTSQTHPYFRAPHVYLATPMRFMPGRKVLTSEQAGDDTERAVTWKTGSELGPLAGTPVRLHFVMKDADLFSLRFR